MNVREDCGGEYIRSIRDMATGNVDCVYYSMKEVHLFGGHAQCVHTIISAHQSNGFFIKNETWMLILSVKVCEERNGIIFN